MTLSYADANLGTPGPSDPGVEVQIPGFIGTVVAQRPNLTAR